MRQFNRRKSENERLYKIRHDHQTNCPDVKHCRQFRTHQSPPNQKKAKTSGKGELEQIYLLSLNKKNTFAKNYKYEKVHPIHYHPFINFNGKSR